MATAAPIPQANNSTSPEPLRHLPKYIAKQIVQKHYESVHDEYDRNAAESACAKEFEPLLDLMMSENHLKKIRDLKTRLGMIDSDSDSDDSEDSDGGGSAGEHKEGNSLNAKRTL